jgi:hypothetical protein
MSCSRLEIAVVDDAATVTTASTVSADVPKGAAESMACRLLCAHLVPLLGRRLHEHGGLSALCLRGFTRFVDGG